MNYSDKLKDPRWQKKRLEILNRDGFRCLACDDEKSTLHVHHCYYVSKREPWDYPNQSLLTLCLSCHEDASNNSESSAWAMVQAWENGACAENARMIHNLHNGADVSCDQGAMMSLAVWWNKHHPDIPFSECLNSLSIAADEDVISQTAFHELNKAAHKKIRSRENRPQSSDGEIYPDLTQQGPIESEDERFFWSCRAALVS